MELTLDCKIKVTEFDNLVLVEYVGEDWPQNHIDHVLLRSADYKKLSHCKKPSQLLPEKLPAKLRVYRYAVRYMKMYLEGDWDASENYDFDRTLDPRRYLQSGDLTNFYVGHASYDGYIRQLDGKILTRKVNCEFWASYYNTSALQEALQKHPQFSSVIVDGDICWENHDIVGSHQLKALYQPKSRELDQHAARSDRKYGLMDIGGSHGAIHNMPAIKKFRKTDDDD